jgi:hypothetical protein
VAPWLPARSEMRLPEVESTFEPMSDDAAGTPVPDGSSPEKPTDQWATGDEPATGPQLSYLQTLAREAGEEVPEGLTKAQASETIDRLQQRSPRVEG